MSNTPENYEIIDIKKQTKEHSQYRKYSGSSIVCPYKEVDFTGIKNQTYESLSKGPRYISNNVIEVDSPYKQTENASFFQKNKGLIILIMVFVAAFVLLIGMSIIVAIFFPEGYHYSSKEDNTVFGHLFGMLFAICLLSVIVSFFVLPQLIFSKVIKTVSKNAPTVNDVLYKCFAKPTLADMKKKFFNALSIEYYLIEEVYSQVDNITAIMAKINPSYKKYVRTDDFISFNYKNTPVDIVEFRSVGRAANSCVFVRTKINRNIPDETYIKSKNSSSNSLSFADNFLVQSANPPEARKFFTTAFMNNLLKYKQGHNCSVDIYLNSKISNRENVFICIISQKNFFEMLESDWQDTNNSAKIIAEIKEILGIVDVLNLEQEAEK